MLNRRKSYFLNGGFLIGSFAIISEDILNYVLEMQGSQYFWLCTGNGLISQMFPQEKKVNLLLFYLKSSYTSLTDLREHKNSFSTKPKTEFTKKIAHQGITSMGNTKMN